VTVVELVYGQTEVVARFVAAAMKDPAFNRGFGECTAIGVAENGDLIGGTVFHDYSPEAGVIEMSSAAVSPRWLAPQMIRAIFGYVFDQLGCQVVVMRVREDNARMVRIAQKFGFDGVIIPRLAGRTIGIWVFTMTEEQWRDHPVNRRGVK
jgi:RimJ/RimL family protein N-acetyltransferase